MKFQKSMVAAVALVLAGSTVSLVACGKLSEPYRDAPRGTSNEMPADTLTFPDGFSNVATKCDHGNRVYVAFKGDDNRAAIAVVAADPTCVSAK